MDAKTTEEALAKAIEAGVAGGFDPTIPLDASLSQAYAANRTINTLLKSMYLPPELAREAELSGDTPCRIGNYPVIRLLGRGNSPVYLAYDRVLDRKVAVKVPVGAGAGQIEEARKASKASDHGIVTIHAVEEAEDGSLCIVMEYLEGGSLANRLTEAGRLSPTEAARLIAAVAEAAHMAHEDGLIHRDLKPENILFDRKGNPHIADFGLALHESERAGRGVEPVGTRLYMSPEQVCGDVETLDRRSDVWSLGVILYRMLTGKQPFTGDMKDELFDRILRAEPASPRQLPDLDAIVLKCLRKSPDDRYATAGELAADLRRFLHGEPVAARPLGRFEQGMYWLRGVPVVARLTGRPTRQPTVAQRRTQRALNAGVFAAFLTLAAVFLWSFFAPWVILGGLEGEVYFYNQIAKYLAESVAEDTGHWAKSPPSQGSNTNVAALKEGRAELALTHLKAQAIADSGAAIVAPVCYGTVYVVVRDSSGIRSLHEFPGKRISLGPKTLGMRDAAKTLLKEHDITVDALNDESGATDSTFDEFLKREDIDAAVVTTVYGEAEFLAKVRRKLRPDGAAFRLLPLPRAKSLADERFSPFEVVALTTAGGDTVKSPIFLAARPNCPEQAVQAALRALFDETADPRRPPYLFTKSMAADFINKRILTGRHSAANEFFGLSSKSPP